MNSFEETEWRERRDCSDRENWMKVLNMGNIQLFWGPLRQLTPQIQKVNFLENDSTKYRKVVRIRKRLGVSWKLDKTTKLMWLGGRRGYDEIRAESHWSCRWGQVVVAVVLFLRWGDLSIYMWPVGQGDLRCWAEEGQREADLGLGKGWHTRTHIKHTDQVWTLPLSFTALFLPSAVPGEEGVLVTTC